MVQSTLPWGFQVTGKATLRCKLERKIQKPKQNLEPLTLSRYLSFIFFLFYLSFTVLLTFFWLPSYWCKLERKIQKAKQNLEINKCQVWCKMSLFNLKNLQIRISKHKYFRWMFFPSNMKRYLNVRHVAVKHTHCQSWVKAFQNWLFAPRMHEISKCSLVMQNVSFELRNIFKYRIIKNLWGCIDLILTKRRFGQC